MKPIVIIESPYRGRTEADRLRHVAYAVAAVRDSIDRGELPIATHLYIASTNVLDDAHEGERAKGIGLGHFYRRHAKLTALYLDLGKTPGMDEAIQDAAEAGCPVETRSLPGWGRESIQRGKLPQMASSGSAELRCHDCSAYRSASGPLPGVELQIDLEMGAGREGWVWRWSEDRFVARCRTCDNRYRETL